MTSRPIRFYLWISSGTCSGSRICSGWSSRIIVWLGYWYSSGIDFSCNRSGRISSLPCRSSWFNRVCTAWKSSRRLLFYKQWFRNFWDHGFDFVFHSLSHIFFTHWTSRWVIYWSRLFVSGHFVVRIERIAYSRSLAIWSFDSLYQRAWIWSLYVAVFANISDLSSFTWMEITKCPTSRSISFDISCIYISFSFIFICFKICNFRWRSDNCAILNNFTLFVSYFIFGKKWILGLLIQHFLFINISKYLIVDLFSG